MDTMRSARVWIVTALIALTTTMIGTASQDGAANKSERSTRSLTGSWLETFTPAGGSPFKAVETYGADGGWISSAQGAVVTGPPLPASFTPAQGQWTHQGGRIFSTTAVSIGSDLIDGHLLFLLKVRQTVTLNKRGDAYSSVFKTEVFDPDGNLLFMVEGTSEAHRISVEPLD
jgi:hypothetical protein